MIQEVRAFQYEELVYYFNLKNEAKILQIFHYVILTSLKQSLQKQPRFSLLPLQHIFISKEQKITF